MAERYYTTKLEWFDGTMVEYEQEFPSVMIEEDAIDLLDNDSGIVRSFEVSGLKSITLTFKKME